MQHPEAVEPEVAWKQKIFEIIFEADTPNGKLFDVVLIGSIILSVLVVMLDSVTFIEQDYGTVLYVLEWVFTILFSIEYVLRIICVRNKAKYIFSFYGIIDLLSIIPTYLSIIIPGSQYFLVIRSLRILRIFRVLKLVQYIDEVNLLKQALKSSARKILVFLAAVLMTVTIMGSMLYVIEGAENGFTSIPRSIYWAIVTITTVGFGDIAPQTGLGQMLAAIVMIMGYGIIAVPTGIVTYDMTQSMKVKIDDRECPSCDKEGHDKVADYCKYCGTALSGHSPDR
jgi:voltage-gated potassium channel